MNPRRFIALTPVLLAAGLAVAASLPHAAPFASLSRAAGVASPPLTVQSPAPAASSCLQRFAALGLPEQRGDSGSAPLVLCRQGYALAYDPVTHDPDWVMEHLTASELRGAARRGNVFKPDPLLPAPQIDNPDYAGSGYDRGHQAPAADAKFAQAVMNESFYFSNMAPQVGLGFNRGAWAYLEKTVREWVLCGGRPELFVMTGPIYGPAPRALTAGHQPIAVPTAFFKIVYDVAGGRAVGFVLPNRKIGSKIDLQPYVASIADIETETGWDFFSALSERRQTVLESEPGVAWAHNDHCRGVSD